ncbi:MULTISPECIES: MogA/MoaB family molybdenum cofactor biosynthesis protein [Clostridium]|uniref:Molybdopterin adenylyltransferase n=2 Tax=Clostridium TaxID=1485 RepID=A0A151ALJ6_9CLOT|nr:MULTISPECIES: MogA/MoaB family molybdenum cofactor biosynthesis protein [Clostridium]KYH28277.1 molybdopterin adenylyltransferase [Clostridium colicanis DSM 13634]MBE6043662.1 MogA/MoaB family molybdenum cofactor biosynthesis protein [Clostridium thermopalmarium]PRR74283.1 Molybdopterin adenylyltransferase [Clostridium thermopalmarium DSM 5974]PVZ22071.1 molybdenum cofactor synthesis domain-containing protein [Clostridium thermopalmarium DSM 5974]
MFKVGILTASDKGYLGQREDKSGKVIEEVMTNNGYDVAYYKILPDEREMISKELIKMCDILKLDLILTTGGTGFSPRDWTPEATLDVIHRETPGISEAMRYYSLKITPKAMLSRGVSGIRNNSLIINLPGSPKAVRENLECIFPALKHGLEILKGISSECARK